MPLEPCSETVHPSPAAGGEESSTGEGRPNRKRVVKFKDDASPPEIYHAGKLSSESSDDDDGPPDILFRTEYQHQSSFEVVPISAAKVEEPEETAIVMEYVRVHLTNQIGSIPKHGISATGKGRSYIKILSPAVIEALRTVVNFFPNQDLAGNTITIYEPYQVLVHFEQELTRLRERLQADASEISDACKLPGAAKHIEVVQSFVKTQTQDKVDAERERYRSGLASYDMLWLLYKPGSDVYFDQTNCGEHEPFVVHSLDFTMVNGAIPRYNIKYWNMNANSTYVGPSEISKAIEPFAGEKAITELRSYPCKYLRFAEGYQEGSESKIRQHFIDRGRKWFKLRQKENCYSFDGVSTTFPRRSFTSLVMVDPIQYQFSEGSERATLMDGVESPSSGLRYCSCARCDKLIYQQAAQPLFAGYTKINPMVVAQMTEHQYFLCDRTVEAFVFKIREWRNLDIVGFNQPKFDKSLFERLVLSQETRDTIKKLTQMYIRDITKSSSHEEQRVTKITSVHVEQKARKTELTWSADMIEGKGEGLTILLHGKPGVGKTYTAECIAEYTERPLLSLTCSDIGVDPQSIEANLVKWFKLARNWGAIMLLDEADIYMEQRQIQDLERNHLVAGFLRALEYYKGILFLTTNRVGTFDEAFISRIHVQLYYPEFGDLQREAVWNAFFHKLEDDRETTMRIPQPTKDYIQSQDLRELKWNGREIRNAFQVAVALAEAEGDKDKQGRVLVKYDHIKATVKMSREFRDYLTKVHGSDQSKRAALKGYRFDAYGSAERKEGPSERY